jgi:hypothetical protein
MSLVLVMLLGAFMATRSAIAADEIFLGTQASTPEFEFIGTGTPMIDILLEDFNGSVFIMASGSANGTGAFGSAFSDIHH